MSLGKGWLERWFAPYHRKAKRESQPRLVAHYWTGGPPLAIGIRDISSTGMYLLTQERWYQGTIVRITLQRKDNAAEITERSIAVNAKAVRCDPNGVGLEFVLSKGGGTGGANHSKQDVVGDRVTLNLFLNRLKASEVVLVDVGSTEDAAGLRS